MLDPNFSFEDMLNRRLIEVRLSAPTIDIDGIGELWESQSPAETNKNYLAALKIVNQAKGQEKKNG